MKPYKVQCLDAAYDSDNEMLVLNCLFEEIQEKRIVVFSKSDFHYKYYDEVPEEEMHKTARMFKGKKFNLVIDDDPNRSMVSEEDQQKYAVSFNKSIIEQLDNITEELGSDKREMSRRLSRLGSTNNNVFKGKIWRN